MELKPWQALILIIILLTLSLLVLAHR